jgi:uncharacterized protein YecT (DUF1311 family)
MKRNSTRLLLLLIVAVMTISGSFAQQKKKANPCDSANNQAEMNICAEKEYKAADAALNKVYGQLMSKLEDDHKAKLKEAELAWIKFRDVNCEFQAFPNIGGTIYPLVYNGCLASMTNDRTKELRAALEEFK